MLFLDAIFLLKETLKSLCNYLIGQSNFHSVPTKALDVADGVYHYHNWTPS